ncbi:MAG: NUMOD4 domain-containing protein [Aeromonas veronii]
MQEIFKDVQGYEGKYQVSNFGRVLSLPKEKATGNGGRERFLKQEVVRSKAASYNRVSFCVNGKVTRYSVHRLVAQAFIPNPLNKPQVNHIDNTGTNNHVSNLEWVTGVENMLHSSVQGRQDEARRLGCEAASKMCQRNAEHLLSNLLGSAFLSTYTIRTPTGCTKRYVEFRCKKCTSIYHVTRATLAIDRGGICKDCYKDEDIVSSM